MSRSTGMQHGGDINQQGGVHFAKILGDTGAHRSCRTATGSAGFAAPRPLTQRRQRGHTAHDSRHANDGEADGCDGQSKAQPSKGRHAGAMPHDDLRAPTTSITHGRGLRSRPDRFTGDTKENQHRLTMPSADAVRNRAALLRCDTGSSTGGRVTMAVMAAEWNVAEGTGGLVTVPTWGS